MAHLTLTPADAVAIDFEVFEFPEIELTTRSSGESLLMLVWSEGRKHLLFDRDVERGQAELMAEVRLEVARFNADTITGWRELVTASVAEERALLRVEREALSRRGIAAARAYENVGLACLRARRAARAAATPAR